MSNDKKFFALRPNYFDLRPVLRDFLIAKNPKKQAVGQKSLDKVQNNSFGIANGKSGLY